MWTEQWYNFSIIDADLTDDGLRKIGVMRHLSNLNLSGNPRLTGKCIEHLSKIKKLKTLALNYCNVGDEFLGEIGKLSGLTRLEIMRHAATPTAILRLKRALPDLNIVSTR